jgi:hypothetical protein
VADNKKQNALSGKHGDGQNQQPGSPLSPIGQGNTRDREPTLLSVDQQELADVCARFADVCDYFSRQSMDLPANVLDDIGRVSKLSVPDRIAAMKRLNQDLMEYLQDVGQDSRIRH